MMPMTRAYVCEMTFIREHLRSFDPVTQFRVQMAADKVLWVLFPRRRGSCA